MVVFKTEDADRSGTIRDVGGVQTAFPGVFELHQNAGGTEINRVFFSYGTDVSRPGDILSAEFVFTTGELSSTGDPTIEVNVYGGANLLGTDLDVSDWPFTGGTLLTVDPLVLEGETEYVVPVDASLVDLAGFTEFALVDETVAGTAYTLPIQAGRCELRIYYELPGGAGNETNFE